MTPSLISDAIQLPGDASSGDLIPREMEANIRDILVKQGFHVVMLSPAMSEHAGRLGHITGLRGSPRAPRPHLPGTDHTRLADDETPQSETHSVGFPGTFPAAAAAAELGLRLVGFGPHAEGGRLHEGSIGGNPLLVRSGRTHLAPRTSMRDILDHRMSEPLRWPDIADEDIVDALRSSGFQSVADRLDYLNAAVAEDPEYDADEINSDSVAAFGKFLLSANPEVRPLVGLHPSAYVFAQWRIKSQEEDAWWGGGEGSLSVVFEPSKLARFAARCGKTEDGVNVIVANGVVPVQDLEGSIRFFLTRAITVGNHVY